MFIITQNSKGVAKAYQATETEARLFLNEPERFAQDLSGWVISDYFGLIDQMSKTQMVSVYNSLSGESLVKFSDKDSGATRTFPVIERNSIDFSELKQLGGTDEAAEVAPKRRGRTDRGIINIDPLLDEFGNPSQLVPCRAGTKQQHLVDALAVGATMTELLAATSSEKGGKSWSESSVKSALYEDINSGKGYGVRTEIVTEGDPSTYKYHLTFHEGITEPLPETPKPSYS